MLANFNENKVLANTNFILSKQNGNLGNKEDPLSIKEKEILSNIQELQRKLVMLKVEKESRKVNMDTSSKQQQKRLLVVTNTLPVTLEEDKRTGKWTAKNSTGGLDKLVCLSGISRDIPFLWVGWVRRQVPKNDESSVRKLLLKFNCIPIFLDPDLSRHHNYGFSSQVLWSLFHCAPEPVFTVGSERKIDNRYWLAYKVVNERFADSIAEIYQENDIVWIHDHHLMLLPSCLRGRIPRCTIGWFLHTPFPYSDVYRRLPVRKELLEGLTSSDLVGFQTYDYARHFLSACHRVLNVESNPKGFFSPTDHDHNHFMSVGVFPIGIDVTYFERMVREKETLERLTEFSEKFLKKRVLLGIDRLDHIKGLPHKLLAMEMLLTKHPEWAGKVVLVQIGISCQNENIAIDHSDWEGSKESYRDLLSQINQLVGRINGAFGSLEYVPIHFIHQSYADYHELCALYKLADVCVVSSTRDGMNLVSHEFVVCQNYQEVGEVGQGDHNQQQGPGVLVLSEFAGSSQSLNGAILINPWNIEDMSNAIHQALTMSKVERELRQQKLFRYISNNTALHWAKSYLCELGVAYERNLESTKRIPRLVVRDVLESYQKACNRLIICDYDGSLLPLQSLPHLTTPSVFIKTVLDTLSKDPRNTVFIVSSRERRFFETWLAGVDVGIAAEDGYFYKMQAKDPWKTLSKSSNETNKSVWKSRVSPLMQYFTERTPGSYIEDKESSIKWHYFDADPHFGAWQAKDLHITLERQLSGTNLEVLQGNGFVEVRHEGCSKYMVLKHVLEILSEPAHVSRRGGELDFIFCVGDGDASDEEMFSTLNNMYTKSKESNDSSEIQNESSIKPSADIYTVNIGKANRPSKASYCLTSLGQLRRILRSFAELSRLVAT